MRIGNTGVRELMRITSSWGPLFGPLLVSLPRLSIGPSNDHGRAGAARSGEREREFAYGADTILMASAADLEDYDPTDLTKLNLGSGSVTAPGSNGFTAVAAPDSR